MHRAAVIIAEVESAEERHVFRLNSTHEEEAQNSEVIIKFSSLQSVIIYIVIIVGERGEKEEGLNWV